MKLVMFEHRSLCVRVRMAAALKGIHLRESVMLDDHTDAMTGLGGKRVIPILVKDDGVPRRVRDYFEGMMSWIGFEPLPAI